MLKLGRHMSSKAFAGHPHYLEAFLRPAAFHAAPRFLLRDFGFSRFLSRLGLRLLSLRPPALARYPSKTKLSGDLVIPCRRFPFLEGVSNSPLSFAAPA